MIWARINTVVFLLLLNFSLSASGTELPPKIMLDGMSFQGELKVVNGFFTWISVDDTIVFEEGNFFWSSGVDGGYKPVPYKIELKNAKIIFTVHSGREEGDYVDWTGFYDGGSLDNVTAVWTRVEKIIFMIFCCHL
ncbi:MAG: hypothetical protein H8E38_10210 [SAR324 cluster bacterium]|nr:hypothetical protein [SAR324 cluster bacterium]MBL7035727.1 hypothetical protein [SAR324 cluster bacterium]